MSNASGRIVASSLTKPENRGREYRRSLTGRISTSTAAVSGHSDVAEDELETVTQVSPFGVGGLMNGVVAAAVRLNGVEPLAVNPSEWDVFSVPVAMLDAGFQGFSLPEVGRNIVEYIEGWEDIEFDEECQEEPSIYPKMPNGGVHNSYALRAEAYVTGVIPDVEAFFSSPNLTISSLSWAGPFANPDETFGEVYIAPHHVVMCGESFTLYHGSDGDPSRRPHIKLNTPDPAFVEVYGVFDLTFTSAEGAPWQLHIVRRY